MIYQTLREKKFDTLRQKLLETQNTTSLLQFFRIDLHIMSLTNVECRGFRMIHMIID